MMSTEIVETLEEVVAMIPRYSWEIMDEEQKDDLMEKVVLPRYMKTTADGTKLTPTAWGRMVGATPKALESRVRRLKQSQKGDPVSASRTNQAASVRHARRVLKNAPSEEIGLIVKGLPAEAKEKLAAAVVDDDQARVATARASLRKQEQTEAKVRRAQRDRAPELVNRGDLMEALNELVKAKRGYARALDAIREVDLSEDDRDAFQEIHEGIGLIHEWFGSYLASGSRGFEAELDEMLGGK